MELPTYFGEVLPYRLRAGDVDADYSMNESNPYQITYTKIDDTMCADALPITMVIFGCGDVAVSFLTAAGRFELKLGTIVIQHCDLDIRYAIDLYRLTTDPTAILVLCDCHALLEQAALAYNIIDTLFDQVFWTIPKQLIVINSNSSANNCVTLANCSNVFALCDDLSRWHGAETINKLAVPSTISGLAAAVMTQCKLCNIPALLINQWQSSESSFKQSIQTLYSQLRCIDAMHPLLHSKVAQAQILGGKRISITFFEFVT